MYANKLIKSDAIATVRRNGFIFVNEIFDESAEQRHRDRRSERVDESQTMRSKRYLRCTRIHNGARAEGNRTRNQRAFAYIYIYTFFTDAPVRFKNDEC